MPSWPAAEFTVKTPEESVGLTDVAGYLLMLPDDVQPRLAVTPCSPGVLVLPNLLKRTGPQFVNGPVITLTATQLTDMPLGPLPGHT